VFSIRSPNNCGFAEAVCLAAGRESAFQSALDASLDKPKYVVSSQAPVLIRGHEDWLEVPGAASTHIS
jgi:hypothetical protein